MKRSDSRGSLKIEADYSRHQPDEGSLAVRLANGQRQKLYDAFAAVSGLRVADKVLDVGVTASDRYEMNNHLALLYPYKGQLTAAGVEAESYLSRRYPGLAYVQISPGRLPFADGSFDWVHANAVIEHVGSRQQQAGFLAELWRVSRRGVFVTTPDRWAPVEFHTVLPFLHWLPAPLFRACLRALGKGFFAEEAHLNLLDRAQLRRLGAAAGLQNLQVHGVRLFGWTSNLWLSAQRPTVE